MKKSQRGLTSAVVQLRASVAITEFLVENCAGQEYQANRLRAFVKYVGLLVADNQSNAVPHLPIAAMDIAAERNERDEVWLSFSANGGAPPLRVPQSINGGKLTIGGKVIAIDNRADSSTIRIRIA